MTGCGGAVRDRFFELSSAVAGCPYIQTCRGEFLRKNGSKGEGAHFATQPWPDFIGSNYRGLVVVGGNPGLAHHAVHFENDAHVERLQQLIAKGDSSAFGELMRFLPSSMEHWPQMVDARSRLRLNYDIEDIAYVDIVKCATRPGGGNSRTLFSKTGVLERCWATHTRPILDLLRPTHVVALWKPIRTVLEQLGYTFEGKMFGFHSGARNLNLEARYAQAKPIFDHFYGRSDT